VPPLMITARDTLRNRIEGLDLGAEDYLVKPFGLEDLRHVSCCYATAAQRPSTPIVYGTIRLDPAGKQAYLDDKPVQLTMALSGWRA
jgi:two-component system, OmpR family, response regulator